MSSDGLTSTSPATSSGRVSASRMASVPPIDSAGDEHAVALGGEGVEGLADRRRPLVVGAQVAVLPAGAVAGQQRTADGEALGGQVLTPRAHAHRRAGEAVHEQDAGAAVRGPLARRGTRTARRRASRRSARSVQTRGSSSASGGACRPCDGWIAHRWRPIVDRPPRSLVWQFTREACCSTGSSSSSRSDPPVQVVFRPTAEGTEHVPATGAAILASNHLSAADWIFMPLSLKRRVTFLAKAEYFTGTGVKGFLQRPSSPAPGRCRSTGPAPRPPRTRSGPACGILREGKLLGIYPEGTRSPGRPAVPRQDRRRPDGAGDRRARRSRWRWSTAPQEAAVRPEDHPGDGALRRAAGLLPLRGPLRRPLRRAVDHRRDHVRDHEAVGPGVRRRLRRDR